MSNFIEISEAKRQGIIPQKGFRGISGNQIYVGEYKGKSHLNVGCGYRRGAAMVIEDTRNKCASLTEEGRCMLTFVNKKIKLKPCPIIQILKDFENNKKAA